MIGLKYILFVKELSLKEIANHCCVTTQLVTLWCSGSRRIPENHLENLSAYFKIEPDLIKKDLTFEDKIKIEMQLGMPGTHQCQDLDTIELYKRHEALKRRYAHLLTVLKETDEENKQLKQTIKDIQNLFSSRGL